MKIEKNTVVTLDLNNTASNTFVLEAEHGDLVLLGHPLAPGVLFKASKEEINKVAPNIKDSAERCIDYANLNKKFLDYNTIMDLESVGLYFAMKRRLTPRQKQVLANICGVIASNKFNNEITDTMKFITSNHNMLDDFNRMWFNNFSGLFQGRQPITSKKQRGAIFNIAGYILAEMENPTVQTRK